MDDLISRKAAIKQIQRFLGHFDADDIARLKIAIEQIRPAQPETHEEHTETHACDYYIQKMQELEQAMIEKAYQLGKEEAREEQRWVPCSERLPEEDGEYLVTKENDWLPGVCVDIARWFKSDHENNGFHKASLVIAWMPLPEPYQTERGRG